MQDFCVVANAFFTIVFAVEMFLRIIAIGPVKWLSDKMNYMDGTIVILSLIELPANFIVSIGSIIVFINFYSDHD